MAFVATVEMGNGHPQRVRCAPSRGQFFPLQHLRHGHTSPPLPAAALFPIACLRSLAKLGYSRKTVFAPKGKIGTEVEPIEWLNIARGNFKTVVAGTCHAFKFAKHARRVFVEVQYVLTATATSQQWCRVAADLLCRRPSSKRQKLALSEVKT